MEPNTTQTPNYLFDSLLAQPLTLAELKIVLAVVRETYGWGESSWEMSITDLCTKTGLARPNVKRAASRLCMGSDRLPALLGRKLNKQGIYVYWLLVDKSSKGGHAKYPVATEGVGMQHAQLLGMQHAQPKEERKILKEKTKALMSSSSMHAVKTENDDDDHKSRFDLDTIRKYAEHLHTTKARAVRNVEGLALSMFKTGADDSRISDWLAKSLAESQPKPEDPYAVFSVIVGLSKHLAERMQKKKHWTDSDDQDSSDDFIEGGAITNFTHYELMKEFALKRLENKYLGLPDEFIEAKRKQFRKVG